MTPYRAQCKQLEEACVQNDIPVHTSVGITIGTAEVFQGQERPIMLISTVRTNESLGFLKDAKVSKKYWMKFEITWSAFHYFSN